MNFNSIISQIATDLIKEDHSGELACYIPELRQTDKTSFAVHLTTVGHQQYSYGNPDTQFTIQSIAKVLSLVLAYKWEDSDLWKRVGVEPSGTSFNSLLLLEHDEGIPRNPFINAGAIVVCDIIISKLKEPKADFLHFVQELSNNPRITYNESVSSSEKLSGFKNYALVNLMKSFGNIKNDIDVVMDFYFDLCSIEMTCADLANCFLFLANNGISPHTNIEILSPSKTKRINAIMLLCGFYDEAGDFAYKVGLPGKSGVSGGIVAVHPRDYAIAVFSPLLNKKGNSAKGMKFLEEFTSVTGLSIF